MYVHWGWGMGWCWCQGWGLEHVCGAGLGWEFKAALTPTAGRHAALAQLFRWGGHPLGMDLLHALPSRTGHDVMDVWLLEAIEG